MIEGLNPTVEVAIKRAVATVIVNKQNFGKCIARDEDGKFIAEVKAFPRKKDTEMTDEGKPNTNTRTYASVSIFYRPNTTRQDNADLRVHAKFTPELDEHGECRWVLEMDPMEDREQVVQAPSKPAMELAPELPMPGA